MDLNLSKYIECGRGTNRVQSSLTLTQEVAENCTGLFEDSEIANLIEHELQMYLHHGSVSGGEPAYFTPVQQICRQDPVTITTTAIYLIYLLNVIIVSTISTSSPPRACKHASSSLAISQAHDLWHGPPGHTWPGIP